MTAQSTQCLATDGVDAAPTPMRWKVLTGAGAILSAAHRSKGGVLHGHTWEITAWWPECPDAVTKQAELNSYLSAFEHTVLGDDIAWGECLAKTILLGLDCVKVEVRRPLERIYAVVERAFP